MKTNIFLISISIVLFFCSIFRIPETSKAKSTVPLSQPKFKKLIYLIIDGLRFDGYVPVDKKGHYYNNFTFIQDPGRLKNTFFSLSGIPTCTTCRVIGMMTGTPTNQIEEIMAFAISKLSIESFPDKFPHKKIHHYGDSMWPKTFEVLKDKSHSFCGLSKCNLIENEIDLIEKVLNDKVSEVKFIHAICLDALGHIYTTNHQLMEDALKRMDDFLHKLYDGMDEDTLLFMTSDHGVTDTGAHGGNSQKELASVCGFYSKKPFAEENGSSLFNNLESIYNIEFFKKFYNVENINKPDDWVKAKTPYRIVYQDDILPTLAYFMGVPTPINTYGNLIPYLIKNEQAYKILAEQKRSIARNLPHSEFTNVLEENYYLTRLIHSNAVGTNPLFAVLSAVIGLTVLTKLFSKSFNSFNLLPFTVVTVMVSHSYYSFASEDMLWLLCFLLINFTYPNLLFSVWYLKTRGESLFEKDKFHIHIGRVESAFEVIAIVLLFYMFKNMTVLRKKYLEKEEGRSTASFNSIFYKNSLFISNLTGNFIHFAVIAFEYFIGIDRITKISLISTHPSLDMLVSTHFNPTISFGLLYFLKNLDIIDNSIIKYTLLSFSSYLLNIEKLLESVDYTIFFVLSDDFGSISNAIGLFTYIFVPRILIHQRFKISSFGLFLSLFGLCFCFACSWFMYESLVFQYFFLGRLFFVTGFFICDLSIEGVILGLSKMRLRVLCSRNTISSD